MTLQKFDLRVQYIPSPDNIVDSFSRNPIGRNDENIINDNPCIMVTTSKNILRHQYNQSEVFKSILKEQSSDDHLRKIINQINKRDQIESPIHKYYCLFEIIVFSRIYSVKSVMF